MILGIILTPDDRSKNKKAWGDENVTFHFTVGL